MMTNSSGTSIARWSILILSCWSCFQSSHNFSPTTSIALTQAFTSFPSSPSQQQQKLLRRYRTNQSSSSSSSSSTLSTTSALNVASTERSCIELIDPQTGCEVVLVGCFHGSPSSAQDVQRELRSSTTAATNLNPHCSTDAVVLELCASRFAGLQKAVSYNAFQFKRNNNNEENEQEQEQEQPIKLLPYNHIVQRSLPVRVFKFLESVFHTTRTKGISTGLASGILGAVSGLQTALSGFTPGLEFTTALEFSLASGQQQSACDLILADQLVDETIEKIGKFPNVVCAMMDEIITMVQKKNMNGSSFVFQDTQWCRMAKALRIALAGDPSIKEYQINVGQVMTRNPVVIQELARLLIPPILLTQMTLTIVNGILLSVPLDVNAAETTVTEASMQATTTAAAAATTIPLLLNLNNVDLFKMVLDALPHIAVLSIMLSFAYALLAVPVSQVILYERDDQLTKGIQAACRLAAAKYSSNDDDDDTEDDKKSNRPGRVVAVLGLLHINGIAQRLLSQKEEQPIESLLAGNTVLTEITASIENVAKKP